MRFPQWPNIFAHSYNSVFLSDLKAVPFSRKNDSPSPYKLCPAFESKAGVPQMRAVRDGLVFFGTMVLISGFIFSFGLLLNSMQVPGLLALLLGGLLLYLFFL